MSHLTAIPTDYGLKLLAGNLKDTAKQYSLIGHADHQGTSQKKFYQAEIETSYFDGNGVLTFIVNLPVDVDLKNYLLQINILDTSNNTVIEVSTPKVFLGVGIGGMVTIKASVKGQPGEVIFKAHDYITAPEMEDLWMNPIYTYASAIVQNATRQLELQKRIINLEKI